MKKIIILLFLILSIPLYFYLDNLYQSYRLKNLKNKLESTINIRKIDKDDYIIDFPKYYINMEISKDRKEALIKHLEDNEMNNCHRVNAVDGNKIDNIKEGKILGYNYKTNFRKGTKKELAITFSHLIAMNKAKEDNCKMAMIMEDDCRFNLVPYWKIKFKEIISSIPKDCEIFLLANRKYKKGNWEIIKVNHHADFVGNCYIITKKGMEKISNFINDKEIKLDINNIVFDQGFLDNFVVYTYNHPLFLLDNFQFSSTHDGNGINKESSKVITNFEKIFL